MFARIVTIPLRAGSRAEFAKAIEKGVIPLLRTHKGFLDEIALVNSDGKIGFGISFWDSKESASAARRHQESNITSRRLREQDSAAGRLRIPDFGRWAGIYFHKDSVLGRAFPRLKVGTTVRFVEEPGEKGPQASTVLVVSKQRMQEAAKGTAA